LASVCGGSAPVDRPAARQIQPRGKTLCQPCEQPPPNVRSASTRIRVPPRRMPWIGAVSSGRARTITASDVTRPWRGNSASSSGVSACGGASIGGNAVYEPRSSGVMKSGLAAAGSTGTAGVGSPGASVGATTVGSAATAVAAPALGTSPATSSAIATPSGADGRAIS
jgi:hypothetical protein